MEMRVCVTNIPVGRLVGKTFAGSHWCTAGSPVVTRKNDISLCIISVITLCVCDCVCVCECEGESVCVCARARVSGADKGISSEVFQNCPDLRCLYLLGYFWAHFFFWLGLVVLPLKVTAIPAQGVVRRENEQDLPQGILSLSIAGNAYLTPSSVLQT